MAEKESDEDKAEGGVFDSLNRLLPMLVRVGDRALPTVVKILVEMDNLRKIELMKKDEFS
jgi:hypothetical protein